MQNALCSSLHSESLPALFSAGEAVDVPLSERNEFELLPDKAKGDVLAKFEAIRFVLAAAGQRWRRCADGARLYGLTQSSVYEAVRTWLATRDWRDLVDRRLVKEWQESPSLRSGSLPAGLPPAWVTECVRRIAFHKGGVRRAHQLLLRDLAAWRRGGPAIAGFGSTPPPDAPGRKHPAGLSYKSFARLKNAATCAAVQLGRRGAEKFLPMVRTTRAGMEFGREFQIDDMFDNVKCVVAGQTAPRRVLRLHIQEYLTGFFPFVMMKPAHKEEDAEGLKYFGEKHAAWLVMKCCCEIGVHPRGGVFMGEGATATMRGEMAERLEKATNGLVRFCRGVKSSRVLVPGQYEAAGKGKPEAKAALESTHNVIQRETANLLAIPGQIGRSPEDQPEEYAGRELETTNLIKLAEKLAPSRASQLRLGMLDLAEMLDLLHRALDVIMDEPEHAIEGWEACGHLVKKWRWSRGEDWRPWTEFEAAPLEIQTEFAARCERGEAQVERFRMTRREAWLHQRAQTELVRTPYSIWPGILGENFMTLRKVTPRGEIVVAEDRGRGEEIYFRAVIQDGASASTAPTVLEPVREYQTWFNPHDAGRLLVRDAAGRWLGCCAPHAVRRDDHAAVNAARAEKKRLANRILAPARELMAPIAAQQVADRAWNEAILAGATPDVKTGRLPAKPSTAAARAARLRRSRLMAETGHTVAELTQRAAAASST